MKTKYQEALDRIKTIDLDMIEDLQTRYEQSHYGIHDYPTLEMSGDIKIIQELVDKETPMKVKPYPEFKKYFNVARCPKCERVVEIDDIYCRECGQKLDWSDNNVED